MSNRLIYTMGPSGAGKDSVLAWLGQHLPTRGAVHFARRVIDRPAQANGETHESLSTADFLAQSASQAFALNWTANGHHYGVRHAELAALERNQWVFVNGSREYLHKALDRFPFMVVLHITAPIDVLARRLARRQRESAEQIAARLGRVEILRPTNKHAFIELQNDSTLDTAGYRLVQALSRLPGWMDAHPLT
jgi:ribose 1,5-bisphosphokinase